ncbi:helix-turn-helix domain-containing protein [Tateyamaria sp.]
MTVLSEYLQSAELTAAELARQLNTSRGYIHDLASGRRSPSIRMGFVA